MKHSIRDRVLKIILLLVGAILLSSSTHSLSSKVDSYDITGIYEKVELKSGSKVLDSYGNVIDAKAVYVPTKIDTGKYEVELTRIDSNFYQIYGTNLYIETKYCYEYATREEAILNITSNYGYTRGEVIFLE